MVITFLVLGCAVFFFLAGAAVALVLLTRRAAEQVDAPPVRDLLASARRRALAAVVTGGLVALALVALASVSSDFVGLPYLLVPGISGTLGLALYAAMPPRAIDPTEGESREASLVRRTPISFLTPGTRAALVLVVVAQVGVVFTGVTGSADEQGRLREISFRVGNLGSVAGPYGGWFYAGPLLGLDVVFLLVLVLALRRIATTPAIGVPGYAEIDGAWRNASCRVVVALAVAALLLPAAGLSLVSGISAGNAWFPGVAGWWKLTSQVLLVGGILAVLVSILALAVAVSWAFALPRVVASEAAPPPAPAGPAMPAGERR